MTGVEAEAPSAARARALRRAALPLAVMAAIFHFSAQPDAAEGVRGLARLAAHAAEFGLLAALWAWALGPVLRSLALAAAAAVSLLYAGSDELHQSHVPGRHGDPLDLLADAIGIALAVALIALARSRRRADRDRAPPA